jgi:hypothetical protein
LSTESRHSAVRNRSAVINNAYLHAKHNAESAADPLGAAPARLDEQWV